MGELATQFSWRMRLGKALIGGLDEAVITLELDT
jgi:hypothetical protein